jgi:hypothetical protein
VGTAQNPIPTPENPLGYVPTGTPIQQVEAYSKAKLVSPPEVAIAAAPEIIKRADAARKAAGLDPDATRVDLFAAGGSRQSGLEADLEAALGLPYGASPSQLKAALQARQDAAPKPETVEPGAQPEAKPDTDLPFPANLMERDTLKTPDGTPVEVQYAVVSLDSLVPSNFDDGRINPAYPAVLQPRDRTTVGTQEQLQKIIAEFDPRFLGKTPTTNNGAPIIDTQGNVESGNGRAMMFERIHRDNPDLVAEYQKFLTDNGFNTDGITNPILVRIRRQPMTEAELLAYIMESNTPETKTMSALEVGMSDARAMTPDILAAFRGGDIDSVANATFVNRFISQIVAGNERDSMRAKDGTLSQNGVRRIRNALFAKAYGDADVLGKVAESTDDASKTISSALMDIAPIWAQMRVDAESGKIDPAVDKTDALLEAVRLVDRSRSTKTPIPMMLAQQDMLSGNAISPEGLGFLDLMYRNVKDYKQPVGKDKLTGALAEYARRASQILPGADLLGNKPDAATLLMEARAWLESQYSGDTGQTTMALPVNPEPSPQPTPEQLKAQAQAEAEAAATQTKLDAQYIPQPTYDPAAVDPAKRAAGIANDPKYRDSMDILGKNSITLDEANAFVLEQAERNGFENYVAWDVDTGEVLGAGTSQETHSVGFSKAFNDAAKAGRNVALTHNHPSTGSVSTGDVIFLRQFGDNVTIHAVGANGNSFSMQLTPEGAALLNKRVKKSVRKRLDKVLDTATVDARRALIAEGMAEGNPDTGEFADKVEGRAVWLDVRRAVNQALAEVGLVVYNEVDTTPRSRRQDFAIERAKADATEAFRRSFPISRARRPRDAEEGLGEVQQPQDVRPDGPIPEGDQRVDRPNPRRNRARDITDTAYQNEPSDELIVAGDQSDPIMQDAVDTYRDMMPKAKQKIEVPDWLDLGTNEGSAAKAAMDLAKNPGKAASRWALYVEEKLVNALSPVREFALSVQGGKLRDGMEDMYKAAEIAINDSGRNEQLMLHGGAKLGPQGQFYVAKDTIGLNAMFQKLTDPKKSNDENWQNAVNWMSYMGARRAEEYKAKGLKPPLTDQQIADGLALRNPLFEEIAADWKRFNDANVDFLVDTGRISRVLADKLKSDAAYIPFYRSDTRIDETPDLYDQAGIEKASKELIRSGGSLLARNPRIEKLKGGDVNKVNNLFENMIRNSQAMVAAGMRNYAVNLTTDAMVDTGYAKFIPARQQNDRGDYVRVEKPKDALRVWKKGQESYLIPESAEAIPVIVALAGMEPVRLRGIVRFMANVAAFYRQSVTLNPGFMFGNHARDTVGVAILTGGKNLRLNPFQGVARGWDTMGKQSASRQAFTAMSGMGDYRFGGADIGMGKNDVLWAMGWRPSNILTQTVGQVGYSFRQIVGQMERAGTAFELANRMTYYETLLAQGVRQDEAAYQALTLVNYNRRGSSTILRGMLPLLPFLNARIQGLARMYEDVVVVKSPAAKRQALMRLALNGSLLSMFSVALWAWNNEDEERREKFEAEPLYRRLNNHIMYLPNGKTLLIPKAFEIGTVFSTIPELVLEAAVQGDTEELGAATAMTLMNTFAFNPIPQAMVPALEVMFNYNMFTGQPVEGRRLDDDLLTDRINPQTAALAIALSQSGLGRLTGLSPIQFDHLMQGYGGLAYSLPATTVDVVAGSLGLIPSRPSGVFEDALPEGTPAVVKGPVVGIVKEAIGRFYKDPDDDYANRWVEEFYASKTAITQLYRAASRAAEEGDIARAKELLARAPASPAAYKLVNTAGDKLGKINTAMREIRQDPKMTADQKRAALRPLLSARNKLAGKVMEVVRDLEEKQGTSFRRAAY